MNLKKLYLATAILAILAVVTYFIKNAESTTPEDARIGETPLASLKLDDVSKIKIQADGETMTFMQNEERTGWLMEEKHSLPANLSMLTGLVRKINDTRIERVASSNPDRIAELGFGNDSISFMNDASEALLTLEFGRQTENGKQLMKFADEDRAFIVNSQFTPQSNPSSWLNKKLIEIQREDIVTATFTFPDAEPLSVQRESSEADWTTESPLPEGKELDQGAITRALNRFTTVNYSELKERDDPLIEESQPHARSISFGLDDGYSYNITLSQRPEVKVTKEVETTNDDGETVMEEQEEVETPAGPVFISIMSSDPQHPINEYMKRTAYTVGAFLLTNLPDSPDALLQDIPEPAPEIAVPDTSEPTPAE